MMMMVLVDGVCVSRLGAAVLDMAHQLLATLRNFFGDTAALLNNSLQQGLLKSNTSE